MEKFAGSKFDRQDALQNLPNGIRELYVQGAEVAPLHDRCDHPALRADVPDLAGSSLCP
jgi:hypothetical protein